MSHTIAIQFSYASNPKYDLLLFYPSSSRRLLKINISQLLSQESCFIPLTLKEVPREELHSAPAVTSVVRQRAIGYSIEFVKCSLRLMAFLLVKEAEGCKGWSCEVESTLLVSIFSHNNRVRNSFPP